MISALPNPRTFAGAIVAGAVGGVTIVGCFAACNALLRTPGFSLAGLFAFDASTLVGKTAYNGASYVVLGVGLHFAVAIGWAIGYAVVADRQSQLRDRPYLSGAMFGLLVYFAMQLVIVAANLYRIPTPSELGIALLAHLVCYGIPVALVIARMHHPR